MSLFCNGRMLLKQFFRNLFWMQTTTVIGNGTQKNFKTLITCFWLVVASGRPQVNKKSFWFFGKEFVTERKK